MMIKILQEPFNLNCKIFKVQERNGEDKNFDTTLSLQFNRRLNKNWPGC